MLISSIYTNLFQTRYKKQNIYEQEIHKINTKGQKTHEKRSASVKFKDTYASNITISLAVKLEIIFENNKTWDIRELSQPVIVRGGNENKTQFFWKTS